MKQLVFFPFAALLFILPFPGTVAFRLLCLAAVFLLAVSNWRRWSSGAIPCKPAFIAWAGLAVLSLSYAADPAYSFGEVKNEVGYALMIFIAFFAVTRSLGTLMHWMGACLVSLLVISLWILGALLDSGYWNDARGHGGVGSYASTVAMALPMLALAWWLFGKPWQRIALAVFAMLVIACAYFAHQRILWVVIGTESVLAVMLMRHCLLIRANWPLLAACLLGLALVSSLLVVSTHEGRLAAGDKVSAAMDKDSRLAHWERISEEIARHPLVGAGFGRDAMKKAYPDLVPDQSPLWHPHNLLLTYGIGMGLPGIAVLLWLFASLIREYWKHRHHQQPVRRMVAVVGVLLVAGLVTRNLTNDFFVRDGALLFWALNGSLLGYLSSPSANDAGVS
jgi:O-antigen ligase